MQIRGVVQPGKGDASKWLRLFADAYSLKTGSAIYPGSLNIDVGTPFDWYSPYLRARHVWFDRTEMGGERDVLLVPCELVSLAYQAAFLWSTTTAARERADSSVVEIICDVGLRAAFGLKDADTVVVQVL